MYGSINRQEITRRFAEHDGITRLKNGILRSFIYNLPFFSEAETHIQSQGDHSSQGDRLREGLHRGPFADRSDLAWLGSGLPGGPFA